MKIRIATRRLSLQINKRKIKRLADMLYAFSRTSAKRNKTPDYETITIVITSDAGIQYVNRLALNHEGPTDVITLSYAATPGAPATAEIFVNAQRATEVASKTRARLWSPEHELTLYIAHGFDHLAGNEDASLKEAQNMRRRELNWVRRADALDLIDGILTQPKPCSSTLPRTSSRSSSHSDNRR